MTLINRTDLMHRAWTYARQEHWSRRLPAGTLRSLFAAALRRAWADLKAEARRMAERAAELATLDLDALRAELATLENTDRLGHAGILRLSQVRDAIAAREAADYAAKRGLIAAAGGRICAVTFTKKDGSLRTMKVQPASLRFRVKGEDACPAARKAAATRAERHPNLMPVWDIEKGAARSVNLATISRIVVDGRTHTYA